LIGALFNAAGSKFFVPNPAYDTDSYQRKLFSGKKPLTQEMKDSFPKPIDIAGLTAFFDTRIGDTSLPLIMAGFAIPSDEAQDKALFISVLCSQFQRIIAESTDEADDVVASEYKRSLRELSIENTNQFPYYPGDDMLLIKETVESLHNVHCYDLFEHTWTIKNTGKVTWNGRFLVCTNQHETRIEAINSPITISTAAPGDEVCLTAKMDARGFEGNFESIWQMQDDEERICFPDKNKSLKLTVAVTHKRSS